MGADAGESPWGTSRGGQGATRRRLPSASGETGERAMRARVCVCRSRGHQLSLRWHETPKPPAVPQGERCLGNGQEGDHGNVPPIQKQLIDIIKNETKYKAKPQSTDTRNSVPAVGHGTDGAWQPAPRVRLDDAARGSRAPRPRGAGPPGAGGTRSLSCDGARTECEGHRTARSQESVRHADRALYKSSFDFK